MKEKKITFNEKIDNAINGYSLAITFIGIGIFLLNNLEYFGNKIVSIVILSLFSVIGVCGTFVELGKNDTIKGFNDFGAGLVLFTPWLLIYIFGKKVWLNVLGFILLIVGGYGIVTGIIKILVSIFMKNSSQESKLKNICVNFFNVLPAIASFILVVFNILKIALEIQNL